MKLQSPLDLGIRHKRGGDNTSEPGGSGVGVGGSPSGADGTSAGPGRLPPITDDDGSVITPVFSDFAQEQLDGAIRDILDEQVPTSLRLLLVQLLPGTYVGALFEHLIVNPLLAVPAQARQAALLLLRAKREVEAGEFAKAVQDEHEAEGLLRAAGMAILAVVPITEGVSATETAAARMSRAGVKYLGYRFLDQTMPKWALHQMWVTKSHVDHVFQLQGLGELAIDGWRNKNGLDFVDKAANMLLVEAKMPERIDLILRDPNVAVRAFAQLEKYIALAQRLELGGVEYVITEGFENPRLTIAFREAVTQRFPELVGSWVPPGGNP